MYLKIITQFKNYCYVLYRLY